MIDLLPRRLVVVSLLAVAVVIVAGMGYVFTSRAPSAGVQVVALGIGGIIGAFVLLRVPVHWLPAMALAFFAVVPTPLTPSSFTFRMTLWGVILIVWVARRALTPELWRAPIRDWMRELVLTPWRAIAILAFAAFLVWAAVATVRGSFASAGISWMFSVAICVGLPMLVFDAQREAVLLRRTWVVLSGLLALYACLELVAQSSPLIGAVYGALGVEQDQHWSLYRAEITFGHPLLAGTFLTVGAALAFGAWLQGSRRSDLLLGILASAGVVATVSRGPMAAVAVAVVVALVAVSVMNPDRSLLRPGSILVAGLIAGVGVLNFEPVTARNNNLDASISAGARDLAVTVAIKAAQLSNWLGSGAATSGISGRNFSDVVIENSFLQLLISVGIPGLLFFVILIVALFGSSLSRRDVAPAAGLLGFLICLAGYNAIDAVRPSHLLLGFLVIICLNPVHVPDFSRGIRMRQPLGARIFDAPMAAGMRSER
ncbi:O-antigen ligase [Rathayibacter agropyri]